jgi:hypothetical protein
MKTHPLKTCVGMVLYALLTTSPVLAQDTMPGMDMSSPQQSAPKKTAIGKPVRPSVRHAMPARKVPGKMAANADAMSGMEMPSMDGAAQDAKQAAPSGGSMQGMDMSSMDMPKDQPRAMPGMDMSKSSSQAAMPDMDMAPPPQTTGAVRRLDNGAQDGVRPVVRGLGAPAMSMPVIDP